MKSPFGRRLLFRGGAGALIGGLLRPARAQTTGGEQSPYRVSQLFGNTASNRRIQDILAFDDTITSLHSDSTGLSGWLVTRVSPEGEKLWEHSLPRGIYAGLGFRRSDNVILIHAFSYRDGAGSVRHNTILRLVPVDGSVEPIDIGGSSARTRLFCAGDSLFIRAETGQPVEIWDARSIAGLKATTALVVQSRSPQVEAMTADLVAIAETPSTRVALVSLSSGRYQSFKYTSPSIDNAEAHITKAVQSSGIPPSKFADIGVAAAVGANHQNTMYSLIYQGKTFDTASLVSLDSAGNFSALGDLNISIGTRDRISPVRLVSMRSDLGIVFASGMTAWYSL